MPESSALDSKAQLTAAQQRQRETAAVKHGVYATKTAARQRQRRLRDRVRRLRQEFPALADKPRSLILRYAEVEVLVAALWIDVQERGVSGPDGELRRVVTEYRHLNAEMSRLARTLGILVEPDDDPLAALGIGGR
jgi:hypothetical protein